MCSSSAGFRPGPWSITDIRPTPSTVETAISTALCCGVWTSALRTRFPSTWRSRVSSPATTTGPGADIVISRRGVAGDRLQVNRLALERAALVEACDQQHVIDQNRHPDRFLLDAPPSCVGVSGGLRGAAPEHLRIAADRSQGSAQLV